MSMTTPTETLIKTADPGLYRIGEKILGKERITPDEGEELFVRGSLPFLGALANHVRERMHGDRTYFNRNFHIEPTNVCVFSCQFCSYSRLYAHRDRLTRSKRRPAGAASLAAPMPGRVNSSKRVSKSPDDSASLRRVRQPRRSGAVPA